MFNDHLSLNSYAFMLGDDNLFASNRYYDPEDIIRQYLDYGLKVKVNVHTQIINSKFL